MAGFKSTYLANQILDAHKGAVAYSAPGTVYFALFTTAPTAGGGGVEVSGGSYARVSATNNATTFPASSGGSKKIGITLTWPAPTADWGVCVGIGEFDNNSGGNFLTYEPFATPVTILNGSPAFVMPINSITYTEA